MMNRWWTCICYREPKQIRSQCTYYTLTSWRWDRGLKKWRAHRTASRDGYERTRGTKGRERHILSSHCRRHCSGGCSLSVSKSKFVEAQCHNVTWLLPYVPAKDGPAMSTDSWLIGTIFGATEGRTNMNRLQKMWEDHVLSMRPATRHFYVID